MNNKNPIIFVNTDALLSYGCLFISPSYYFVFGTERFICEMCFFRMNDRGSVIGIRVLHTSRSGGRCIQSTHRVPPSPSFNHAKQPKEIYHSAEMPPLNATTSTVDVAATASAAAYILL